MAWWLDGERTVVALFVARVIYSLPLSLLPHGFALSLVAVSALSLDVLVDHSTCLSQFNTRRGASSGILLGAVTLPAVIISKMIQLSRAHSLDQELESLTMQYWAASACCLSVLIFLCVTILCAPENRPSPPPPPPPPPLRSLWHSMFSLSCLILHTAVCCVTLCASSHTSFEIAMKLFWMFCHGLAAVKLIQHVFRTFPSCASIGETCLVASALVLYFGDMWAYTIEKVSGLLITSDVVQHGSKTSEISIIIQGLLLGLLLFPVVFKFFLRMWKCSPTAARSEVRTNNEISISLVFFSFLGAIIIVIIPAWMQFVHDFHMHPYLWVLSFIFSDPIKRLSLCAYWVCVISVSVLKFYNISKDSKIERILLRKYYHLMAVIMFVPALIFQPEFLDLSFGAALVVFLALEIIRVWRIWPLGQFIHKFMSAFTDHRDSDLLVVSHFSLLLGCAIPIWMSSGYCDRPLAPFSGILSLGIGDTMASVVGHKYGVLRWSKTGKKTIEGTAAGITSVLAACSVLLPLIASTGYIVTEHWFSILAAVTVSGLLEAYTTQLDNAFIPLIFYSLLCL